MDIITFFDNNLLIVLLCLFINMFIVEIFKPIVKNFFYDKKEEKLDVIIRTLTIVVSIASWVILCDFGVMTPVNNHVVDGIVAGLVSSFLYDTGINVIFDKIRTLLLKN